MKRRLLLIMIVLVSLLAAGAIGVEAVLRSDLPRRLAVDRLQRSTGLSWHIGSLRTSWRGDGVLEQVEARLPLERQPLMNAPTLRVKHTPLLRMLINGFSIESIAIDAPTFDIAQERDGATNAQRAIESIIAANTASADGRGAASITLPRVDITQATVRMSNQHGETRTLRDVTLQGIAPDPLTWRFSLAMPDAGDVRGRVVTGSGWRHNLEFDLRPKTGLSWFTHLLEPDLASRIERALAAGADGTWIGQLRNDALVSRLSIRSVDGELGHASGAMSVRVESSRVVVDEIAVELRSEPINSLLRGVVGMKWGPDDSTTTSSTRSTPVTVMLTGGPVIVNDQQVRFESLHVHDAFAGYEILMRGEWSPRSRVGSAAMSFAASGTIDGFAHAGRMDVMFDVPALGEARLRATVESRGRADVLDIPDTAWNGRIVVDVRAESIEALRGRVVAEEFTASLPSRIVTLDGASITMHRQGDLLRIDRVITPGVESEVVAQYDLASGAWEGSLSLKQWLMPKVRDVPEVGPMDVQLVARGDHTSAQITHLRAVAPYIRIEGNGAYRWREPSPFDARLRVEARPNRDWSITWTPPITRPPVSTGASPLADALTALISPPSPSALMRSERGKLDASLHVRGSIAHLNLVADGRFTGRDLPLGERARLDPLAGNLSATINDDFATFNITIDDLLGGSVQTDGRWDRVGGEITARIDAADIDSTRLQRLLGEDARVQGSLTVGGNLHAAIDDPAAARFDGRWTLTSASAFAQELGTMTGHVQLRDGTVRVQDASANRADGSTLIAHAQMDLNSGLIEAGGEFSEWMVRWPMLDADITVTGTGRVRFDRVGGLLTADVDVAGNGGRNGRSIAPLRVSARVADNQLRVLNADAAVLGGMISVSGASPLRNLQQFDGEVRLTNLDLTRLHELWPAMERLPPHLAMRGMLDGHIRMQHATDPRAPEPLQASITIQPRETTIGGMTLGESTLTMHIGATRAMIDASHLDLAGGSLDAWAQLSWAHDGPFLQVQAAMTNLQLDQIVRTVDHDTEVVPGVVNGRFAAGGYVLPPHRAFGQAEMSLRESDLANVPLFNVLYRTMNLRLGQLEPEGAGIVRARLDGDALEVTRMTYFNRGIDVVSLLRVDNIWSGTSAPINGFAVGAFRPLKRVDLPLIRDIDTAMKVFQAGAGSVRIQGTVGEHEIRAVPFADIAGAVRSALSGL